MAVMFMCVVMLMLITIITFTVAFTCPIVLSDIVSYFLTSCPISYYPILSYLALYCLVLSRPILSYPILSYAGLHDVSPAPLMLGAEDGGAAGGRLWNLAGLETEQRAYTVVMTSANGSSVWHHSIAVYILR